MTKLRRLYKSQLRRQFQGGLEDSGGRVSKGAMNFGGIILKQAPATMICHFPPPASALLPKTWKGKFYEKLQWPVETKWGEFPVHPFRFFLEVQRGEGRRITLQIHDARDTWHGHKLRFSLRFLTFPIIPPPDLSTYIVFADGLKNETLCKWLTVLLAQRSMLTAEEEVCAVRAFFLKKSSKEERSVRLETYEFLRRRFFIPVGGNPSFPLYYQRTLSMLRIKRRMELRSVESPVHDGMVSLKELRWIEPNLHRALLDRISQGKVKAVEEAKHLWVSQADVDRVDDERRANADLRQPKRLPGVRAGYVKRLIAKGMNRGSATRKLKRWINDLQLTEAEIEASIVRGRVVRRHPGRL
jgi:hypothetical protein